MQYYATTPGVQLLDSISRQPYFHARREEHDNSSLLIVLYDQESQAYAKTLSHRSIWHGHRAGRSLTLLWIG